MTIPGRPVELVAAAKGWVDATDLIRRAKAALDVVIGKVIDSFEGKGAKALADNLIAIRDVLEQLHVAHEDQVEKTVGGLVDAARGLAQAIAAIPVPSWVAPAVVEKQQAYDANRRFEPFRPNEFYDTMPWSTWVLDGNSMPSLVSERFWYAYDRYMGTAGNALTRLEEAFGQAKAKITPGTELRPPRAGGDTPPGVRGPRQPGDATTFTPPLNPASPLTGGLNTAGLGLAGPPTTNLDTPDLDTPGFDPGGPDASGFDTAGLSDEELARLRAGGGGAGLAGLGGLGGADGLGAGLGRLGPLISPEAMVGAQPGTGPAGARLGGAGGGLAGLGAGTMGMGMIPAGLGAGAVGGAGGGEHSNKLIEDDESIFAPRGDADRDEDKGKGTRKPRDMPSFLIE